MSERAAAIFASDLTVGKFVRGFGRLAVRTRRTSEETANNEAMKLMNPTIEGSRAAVVPAQRTWLGGFLVAAAGLRHNRAPCAYFTSIRHFVCHISDF